MVPSVAPTSRSSNAVNHQGLWGLRGLAAGLLLLPHVAVVVYDFNPSVGIAQWATLSTAFVHIFLIQSAYLLGRGFIRRQAAGQPPASTRAFLWGRGTRIYPGYWLMLVIAVPIMHLAVWSNPIDTLAAFFAVNVYSIPALLSAPIMVWCLQVEVGFYLLLPVHDRLSRKLLGPGHELLPVVPWLEAETRRGDPLAIVQAGRALSRYDARAWAHTLGVPAGSLVTTADRLVLPRKQRELASALRAHVVEVAGDHLVPWEQPRAFSDATLALVDHLTGRIGG